MNCEAKKDWKNVEDHLNENNLELKVKFRIESPMFLGGAKMGKPELREASIKGALRFWLRAVAHVSLVGNLDKVRAIETSIFGSAEDKKSLKSPIILKIVRRENEEKKVETIQDKKYFGYGIDKKRSGFSTSETFEVVFREQPRKRNIDSDKTLRFLNNKEKLLFLDALRAFSYFGGIGARSRKGFGSVTIQSISVNKNTIYTEPESVEEAIKDIKDFISQLQLFSVNQKSKHLPRYTAFSSSSRIEIVQLNNKKNTDLHKELEKEMIQFRKKHKVNRHVFGLPHIDSPLSGEDRRASPLFISNHSVKKEYYAVLSMLPAYFLPEVKEKFEPINHYMNCFIKSSDYKVTKVFPCNRKEERHE
ncbi:CRISPR-associated protein Cmr1 [Tindallia magadiensis]|uniref:CRISPR-associated protein Cmr1 n=1 Tax=Tindallia magadiensis TaxID=69895 RepID=A0A1I3ENM5_9FIRM|nr:type III-B CRISPR module RAMP protein Cmr1 [Tindallia magadiensis]SFI00594.1 CRISPR-associated protein Cmr1 [Tindallia magadiensis]